MSMLANPTPRQVPSGTTISIPIPADFHHHFRQDALVPNTVAHASQRFCAALAMPNTQPPITTVPLCLAYKAALETALAAAPNAIDGFKFINVLYLTDVTTVETVREMHKNGIAGFKYVTTHTQKAQTLSTNTKHTKHTHTKHPHIKHTHTDVHTNMHTH